MGQDLELFFSSRKIYEDLFSFFEERLKFRGKICNFFVRRPFFVFGLEDTCALCHWLWPRAFLSLASRGSVLDLGFGLGFFLCPRPWPRALCPRLHVCSLQLNMIDRCQSLSHQNDLG